MPDSPERIVDSRPIYDGRIVRFRLDTVALPDGSTVMREIIHTPGAVVIVPLTDDSRVRLVRQYRSAAGEFLLELPAGTLEPGESPGPAVRALTNSLFDPSLTGLPAALSYCAAQKFGQLGVRGLKPCQNKASSSDESPRPRQTGDRFQCRRPG